MSRRDARAQRTAATSPQTIWSDGSAGRVDDPRASVAETEPMRPTFAETGALAAPIVGAAPSVEERVEVVEPIADAVVAQAAGVRAPIAPLTRASRRARTAPTVIADVEAAAENTAGAAPEIPPAPETPVESVVPAAAIAWAAAAAAAAEPHPLVPVEPVLASAEPFELIEPADPAPAEPFELIEPADAEPTAEPIEAPADEPVAQAPDVDEFELASRLFAFTGETPVQSAEEPESQPEETAAGAEDAASADSGEAAHVAPTRRRTRSVGRQVATASFSVGVMGIVGLLTVGMTTSAQAVAAVTGTEPTSLVASEETGSDVAEEDIQAYVASDVESASLERNESYTTISLGELASEEGITNYSDFYFNDANAAIQWPFRVGVPITYGFGMRSGRMHEGADFVPGQGADVQAIADGTVRIATNSGGAYGVTVVIDHIIDGQLVSSRYAHMLYGSLNVSVGQKVTVGTILGNTGNTGRSYGAHTHFEILQGGTTAVDPIAWLRSYAGRYSLDHW
ncbi:peptidoglycan DD-metalloendopeptidase family protein [Microbacterium sp. NPDC019599]|uniref:M23 family metallopeptidase n=1 Tax=Microbacterium sp. NPDC019599 TaxID=3154690 RepID=UPI0033F932DD